MNAEIKDEQEDIEHLEISSMIRLICGKVSFSKLRGLLVTISRAIRSFLGGDG